MGWHMGSGRWHLKKASRDQSFKNCASKGDGKERTTAGVGLFAIILWEILKCKLLRGIHLREREAEKTRWSGANQRAW